MRITALVSLPGVFATEKAGRNLMESGGLYVNNERRRDPEAPLTQADIIEQRTLLRRGKRNYFLIRWT